MQKHSSTVPKSFVHHIEIDRSTGRYTRIRQDILAVKQLDYHQQNAFYCLMHCGHQKPTISSKASFYNESLSN